MTPSKFAIGMLLASGIASAAAATPTTELTLYRSDDASLFASDGNSEAAAGYGLVRESRSVQLAAGIHDLTLAELPSRIDGDALSLSFADGRARIVSQRLLAAGDGEDVLASQLGRDITVLGATGDILAQGKLLHVGGGLLVRGTLGTTLVHDYAAVRTSGTDFPLGTRLLARVDADQAGQAEALLSYPSNGLGWRAAYQGTLQPGIACRLHFEARASVANRSGRDWHDVMLALVAGEPRFAKPSAPRPMMAMAYQSKAAAAPPTPDQEQLDDYRSYRLPSPVDLPDGSINLLPLYNARDVACERTALYENGNSYQPPRPMIQSSYNSGGNDTIVSTLAFQAFDSLPAGYLRVLTADSRGVPQFIGEGRIEDTPKGGDVSLDLGNAFDLRGSRERTQFKVDKDGRTLDEAFRITLNNSGDSARTVTVREHPNRWQQWTLASASVKPSRQDTDTLDFKITVPAGGKASLDYAVHYTWTADDQPQ